MVQEKANLRDRPVARTRLRGLAVELAWKERISVMVVTRPLVVLSSNIAFCGVDDGDSGRVKLAGVIAGKGGKLLRTIFCF
jgi:hypothetical protein